MKVAYQGIEGSYSESCAKLIYTDCETIPCKTFDDVFKKASEDEEVIAIIPESNRTTGNIGVEYLIFKYRLNIYKEKFYPINHHLLALPGTNIKDIKSVYSHAQGLSQCSNFIKKNNFVENVRADTAGSAKYISESKINGEKAVRENFPKTTIIKPSIVFSVDDSLTTRFMTLLNLLPFFPLYYGGKTKFAPIHASDVAEIIFQVISNEIFSKKIEAIGPQVLTFKEIIQILLKCIDKKRILIPVPLLIGKISASFLQLFPKPLLTLDQLRLLKYSNIKSEGGKTNFDIGCPSKIFFEEMVKSYSFSWRTGGQFSVVEDDKK